jgi:hypothetical protein
MKEFPYKLTGSSLVKSVVDSDYDKYLAVASLKELKGYVPDVDVGENIDLLPIAFNTCVVNKINKNHDVIDTAVALARYKGFVNKPINIEHNRKVIIGVILSAALSEFGSDKQLTEDEVKDSQKPFNITLGGIVWRVVDKKLAGILESTNDPSSDNYLTVSASWELGFTDFVIAKIKGTSRNLEDAEIISDPQEIEKLKPFLKAFGGTGKLDADTYIYRKALDIIPLGVGLTESPAAEVKGVAVGDTEEVIELTTEEDASDKKSEIIANNISHHLEINVKQDSKIMSKKIKKIQDITDESLKEIKASEISEFIEQELKAESEKFSTQVKEKDSAILEAKNKYSELEASNKDLTEKLKKVQDALAALEVENTKRENAEKFNARMSALDEKFDLTAEDRTVIASQVKDLSDEAYTAFEKNMTVLLKEKSKTHKESLAAEAKKKNEEEEAAKKTKVEVSTASEVVDTVVDKGEKKVADKVEVPATITPSTASLKEKYAAAFAIEQFDIKL